MLQHLKIRSLIPSSRSANFDNLVTNSAHAAKRRKNKAHGASRGPQKPRAGSFPYPLTLIFENDSTARLAVGRPIVSAGRKVVKISIRFTCGRTSLDSSVSERIR